MSDGERGPGRDQEHAVAAYLLRHADFLIRHPQVLAQLQIPHDSAGAISLIERQVTVLREQLAQERGRLQHLVARARAYEELSNRLHALTVQLIMANDLQHAQAAIEATLCEQFRAEAVALKLFPVDAEQRAADPLVQAFIGFVDRDRCLCGPLDPAQTAALFETAPEPIRSAALVPIRGHEQTGVLAIGSSDPDRFSADMGTDLLERLGAITSAKLTDLAHRPSLAGTTATVGQDLPPASAAAAGGERPG
ncbi:MAG: DUF484 family protein [Chromatiaceae bacterium]|nr:MAG: DUF484 family protein [Chromatiaceae bacterium]